MDLSSLNVDVLLYLLKFVEPVDCFNLALSGILKGFENAHEVIDLRQRIECFGIELGLRRGGMCELEIRSVFIGRLPDENVFDILERLAEEGYLKSTQQLKEFESCFLPISPFVEVICSMKNLEKLNLEYDLTLEDLALVFQSCSKLVELNISAFEFQMDKMTEDLTDKLRPGFQRLRCLDLFCFIDNDSWPRFQEMLTWLKECVQLTIRNDNQDEDLTSLIIDGSLTLDPNLVEGLQMLNISSVPAALAKWILSVCFNIHYLQIQFFELPNGFHKDIARLKKLKKLDVSVDAKNYLKEVTLFALRIMTTLLTSSQIVRSCRQVETLSMDVSYLTLEDLAELQPAETMTDITLRWNMNDVLPFKEVLLVVKGWQHVSRLTFAGLVETEISVPSFEVLDLCDFIMGMKHLSHLHIVLDYDDDGQLETLFDKVNELILPLRPNFKFDISCFVY